MSNADELRKYYICNIEEPDEDFLEEEDEISAEIVRWRVPASADLRESWWAVGDQGRTGSCVGWATGDSVLRWHFVKKGLIEKSELLSVRFLWMASKEIDELRRFPTSFIESAGTKVRAALTVAVKHGVVKDSMLPFNSDSLYSRGKTKAFYRQAAKLKIKDFKFLGRDPRTWRSWIANQGPIVTRLNLDDTFWDAKATDGKLDHYIAPDEKNGHAVAMVGYTQDRFIIRNSWDKNRWGDGGFGYATDAYAVDAFGESYGVVL